MTAPAQHDAEYRRTERALNACGLALFLATLLGLFVSPAAWPGWLVGIVGLSLYGLSYYLVGRLEAADA